MSLLTGQIIIEDTPWGFASKEIPVEAFWDDESVYEEVGAGERVLLEPRFRLTGRFGKSALTAVELAQLRGWSDRPFRIILRSRRDGDPLWPQMEVLVRRTSPIRETGPLYRRVGGATVYEDVVEFESMDTVESIPSAIEGGFRLLATDTIDVGADADWNLAQVEAWGDATLTMSTLEVPDGAGGTLTLEVWEPGPPELAALMLQRHATDPYSWALDMTGTYRLGTEAKDGLEPEPDPCEGHEPNLDFSSPCNSGYAALLL